MLKFWLQSKNKFENSCFTFGLPFSRKFKDKKTKIEVHGIEMASVQFLHQIDSHPKRLHSKNYLFYEDFFCDDPMIL